MAEITGVAEVSRALAELRKACPAAARQAFFVCAERCKQTAVRYAPRSPTMANHSAGRLKRKKRTASRKFPGNLEKSIECEYDDTHASVFVAMNALCVSKGGYNYAKKIHDERGKTWQKLGAGSVAKGGKVGDKYIERAIRDNTNCGVFNIGHSYTGEHQLFKSFAYLWRTTLELFCRKIHQLRRQQFVFQDRIIKDMHIRPLFLHILYHFLCT